MPYERNPGLRAEGKNAFGSLDYIQLWKADIQQDHLWLQRFCLLNRLHAVAGLANHLKFSFFLKRGHNEATPRFVIVHHQNLNG